jgi:D-alanine-D-alanine ligase
MSQRLRVALIRGGSSSERQVSLKSGQAVARALDPQRYRVTLYDPAQGLGRLVRDAKKIDVALIIMHGRGGEDGTMQGFLDLLGIPYQSAGVLGCALAMDKPLAKDRYRLAGLAVAPDLVLTRGEAKAAQRTLAEIGLPLVVKPAKEGSSCGISVVRKKKDLAPALAAAFALDRQVLVERFLAGREITCGVLGNDELTALPLVEIIPGKEFAFFDYQAKYLPGASREICPAPLDQPTTALIQDLGKRAHRALGLAGYSRSDFILTDEGPIILETNTIPGMTQTSLLPQAAAAAGLDFPALVDRLIELALARREA